MADVIIQNSSGEIINVNEAYSIAVGETETFQAAIQLDNGGTSNDLYLFAYGENTYYSVIDQYYANGKFCVEIRALNTTPTEQDALLAFMASNGTSVGSNFVRLYITPAGAHIPVTGINISETEIDIVIGQTYQLSANVTPSNATNKGIKWYTLGTGFDYFTVDEATGEVTGVAEGYAYVWAETNEGGYTDRCLVNVTAPTYSVTGVSLSESSISLIPGETHTLIATVYPDIATDKTVYWSSDKPTIASVSSAGVVTGMSYGDAIITVETKDGGFKAHCAVTVKTVSVEISLNVTNPLRLTVGEHEYVNITATVIPTPSTASVDTTVTFTTLQNNGVISVTPSPTKPENIQYVTPKEAGTAILRITSKHNPNVFVDLEIIVSEKVPELITSITFPSPSYTDMVKAEYTIEPTVSPEDADNSLNWSSTDENIVSVVPIGNGSSAKITFNHRGTVTITATAADSSGVSASVTVEVKPRPYICKTDGAWSMATAFCDLEKVFPEIF